MESSVVRQSSEVFAPDPAHGIREIVLVLGQPQLAFLADDVKDLVKVSIEGLA